MDSLTLSLSNRTNSDDVIRFTAKRLVENLGVFFLTFGGLFLLMYRTPSLQKFWEKRKYQKGEPSTKLMMEETVRSLGSVIILTTYEVCVCVKFFLF